MRVFSALAVLIFFVSSAPAFAQGLIKTVAGDAVNGSAGFSGDGGPATSARLFEPYGAIVDGAGNIYLADTRNNRIRKVTGSTGIISTYAGTAAKGFAGDNGPATLGTVEPADRRHDRRVGKSVHRGSVEQPRPEGDARGNDHDRRQNAFYKGEGGPATSAEICNPCSVAIDGSGNLYVSDTGNHAVRKVSGGIITTFAAPASACAARRADIQATARPRSRRG